MIPTSRIQLNKLLTLKRAKFEKEKKKVRVQLTYIYHEDQLTTYHLICCHYTSSGSSSSFLRQVMESIWNQEASFEQLETQSLTVTL